MSTVKTAISVQDSLFRRAERLSRKMRLSRSQLFSRAMEEYLDKHRGQAITAKLNEIYAEPPDDGEGETIRRFASAARKWVDKW